MRERRRLLWLLVLLLYAITWVGGWITHARDLKTSALARYRMAEQRNVEWMATNPDREKLPIFLALREGGPATGVDWCVPILPAILLVDSYSVLGPLKGRGG